MFSRKEGKMGRNKGVGQSCITAHNSWGRRNLCVHPGPVQVVNPVPVEHVALVEAYLTSTGEVGLLAHAVPDAVCLLPLQAGCHKTSQKFLDIMKKLPDGEKKNPVQKTLLTGSPTNSVGENNSNELCILLFIEAMLPTRLISLYPLQPT